MCISWSLLFKSYAYGKGKNSTLMYTKRFFLSLFQQNILNQRSYIIPNVTSTIGTLQLCRSSRRFVSWPDVEFFFLIAISELLSCSKDVHFELRLTFRFLILKSHVHYSSVFIDIYGERCQFV